MMFFRKILLCLTMVTVLLTGCKAPVYNQTVANVADVTLRTKAAIKYSNSAAIPPPTLLVNQGLYVDKTPISLSRQPTWLKNRIVLRGDQLPFAYYSRTVASGGGRTILTHYQSGLDDRKMISVNYSGSVKGALDLLAAKTGYAYSVSGNDVYWQSLITKTFDIAFMPGSSDYMMGKTSGSGSSSGSSGGGVGAVAVSGTIDDSAASQYSNLKGTLSVWKDIESSLKELVSPEGKIMVSEATSSVTVRDHPSNISLASKFIANLNNSLSRQVLVKVQVLDINLSSAYNFGINWNIVQRAFGGSTYQLTGNYGTPIAIQALSGASIPASGLAFDPTKRQTGFTILLDSLKQQGKVSVVSEPRVVCLNNQVSVIRILEQEGYLQSIQTTTLAGSASASGGTVTSQITPGTLVTGLTLYVLPKILGNKIFMQISADISNKLSIDTISSTANQSNGQPVAGSAVIQVPHITQKQFNQRGLFSSGDTLVLAGFRRVSNAANAMQFYDSQALGGRAAQQINSETVVLITPIILNGST